MWNSVNYYETSVLTGGRHFYCSAHAAPRQGSFWGIAFRQKKGFERNFTILAKIACKLNETDENPRENESSYFR